MLLSSEKICTAGFKLDGGFTLHIGLSLLILPHFPRMRACTRVVPLKIKLNVSPSPSPALCSAADGERLAAQIRGLVITFLQLSHTKSAVAT